MDSEGSELVAKTTFPKRLYALVNNPDYQGIINWNKAGDQIIINNPNEFSEKVLAGSEYFPSNYASFVRQLNMYDFHKERLGKGRVFKDCKADIFYNKNFLRDRPSLLRNVRRKTPGQTHDSHNINEDKQNQIQVCPNNYLPNYLPMDRERVYSKIAEEPTHSNNNYNTTGNNYNPHGKARKVSKHILNTLYTNFLKTVSN